MDGIHPKTSALAPTQNSVYRYEKKFVVVDQSISEVEAVIKSNPFLFRSIYHERQVNNIYFDTPKFDYFYDNVNGNSRRKKIRVRWYGDLFGEIDRPVIEAKIKSGDLGTKRARKINGFLIPKQFSISSFESLMRQFGQEESELLLHGCRPTLVNSYIRRYYLSADGRFRVTLDRDLKYYRIGFSSTSTLAPLTDRRKLILELKYDQANYDSAREITKYFPYRLNKNSKYVSGIKKTFYHLAENEDLGDAF